LKVTNAAAKSERQRRESNLPNRRQHRPSDAAHQPNHRMRPQARRARAIRRVAMLPAALDTDQEADPKRHRQALEHFEEELGSGIAGQVLVWPRFRVPATGRASVGERSSIAKA
jgi:hypothetical protein